MRTPWWSTRDGRAAIVFAAAFLMLVGAGCVGMRRVPWLAFARQEVPWIRTPDPTWFPVFRGGSQLDHGILWYRIGPSIEHARRSTVLFVGTSQMQFAIPPHEVRAFEKRSRVSAFSLALPFAEGYGFTLRLIDKHDLHPRIVVAHFDFMRPGESPEATRVVTQGRWATVAAIGEERLATLVWPVASRVLPSFATTRSPAVLLRSSTDGTWMPIRWPNHHNTINATPGPLRWRLRDARAFREALAKRGTQLVLTCIPNLVTACAPEALLPLARELQVPMIVPRVEGPLWTGDAVHLSPASGKRFGRALMRELGKLPAVRALAGGSASRAQPIAPR